MGADVDRWAVIGPETSGGAAMPRRIFVRAPNRVGDLVMATPSFERLRAGHPGAEIIGGIRPAMLGLCSGAPWFDSVLDCPRPRTPWDLWRMARALRRARCDLAVLFPNSLESGLVAWLARIPERVGFAHARPGLMTRVPETPPRRRGGGRGAPYEPEPMPRHYARLGDAIGLPALDVAPRLYTTEHDEAGAAAWLAEHGLAGDRRLVLLVPGAAFGSSKLWTVDGFAAVARHFAEREDTAPVVVAGPSEYPIARAIAARAGPGVTATIPTLAFGPFKGVVRRAALVISTDTGPRHVALALGVPVVCLMGPNDARYTSYAQNRQIVLQRTELACVPCQQAVCPLGHHECMTGITVSDVLAACARSMPPG